MKIRAGIVVLGLALLPYSAVLGATPAVATSSAKAHKVLEAMRSGSLTLQAADTMIAEFRRSMPDVPPEFWTAFRLKIQPNELIDLVAPVYQRNLTDDELDGLLRFYTSPAGKRYTEKQTVLLQESMEASQAWGRRVVEEALNDLKTKRKPADSNVLPSPPVGGAAPTKAYRLLEAIHSERLALQAMDGMMAAAEVSAEIRTAIRARMRPGELMDLLAPIYERNVSSDDLDALLQFFTSPIGKRFIEKQPAILQESMRIGQKWGMEVMERALADLDATHKRNDASRQSSSPATHEHSADTALRNAAERGDAESQWALGYMYEQGKGVPQDFTEAAKWYRKAADQGYRDAQSKLCDAYLVGSGVPKDPAEAAKWLRKAAEQGDAVAQSNLGAMYGRGEGVRQDFVEETKWYRKAAEQGLATAQFNLASSYENGEGVTKDLAEAAKWYRKAAEQGFSTAQFNLGNAYMNAAGVEKDLVEAAKWLRKSAEQGEAGAQFNLALLYTGGQGVPKDLHEAARWYRKAAEHGDPDLQYEAGSAFLNGDALSDDPGEAMQWLQKSAAQGYAKAKEILKTLTPH